MKIAAYIVCTFLGFTVFAAAQQHNEPLSDRQPPVVTEQQVERHQEMAQQERKRKEYEKKFQAVKQQQDKQKEKAVTAVPNTTSAPNKISSKKPERQ